MSEYQKAYKSLNPAQKSAVDTIEGPVLVIAGPGTGKTQLLTTRVAHILNKTDTPPQAILCLTFTDSGVQAMRERLVSLIGESAYDVQISTYHAFGSDLIRRFPDYTNQVGWQPIDELGRDKVLSDVLDSLDHRNPLRFGDVYKRDLQTFISDAKRALLSPKNIEEIAQKNIQFITDGSQVSKKILGSLDRISTKSVPLFEEFALELQKLSSKKPNNDLNEEAFQTLLEALAETEQSGKSTALTIWKNGWLAKDEENNFVIAGREANLKLVAAAEIFRKYQRATKRQKLYDYDDMILRAIESLESNAEFKLTLADQYLYILLDEFQDTNASQLRLVELLSDNPVHEGRPNVLAVGDDDQAIYAFQGADHSNMLRFASNYRDVKVVSLENNYRSQADILRVAHGISGQIEERLHHNFTGISKQLQAAGQSRPKQSLVAHQEFSSDGAQNAWITQQIQKLLKAGRPPKEIAVLAPRHKYLESLVPYLQDANIAVQYEKRENILEDPLIRELETMARLVTALHKKDFATADNLWPVVLSFAFWQLPNEVIWKLSWQAYYSRASWTILALDDHKTRPMATYLTKLAELIPINTAEEQLDLLMGTASRELAEELGLKPTADFYDFYFSKQRKAQQAGRYTQLLSNLSSIRYRLREYRRQEEALSLDDFVQFIDDYRASGLPILNTNPYHATGEAVQLMTAYKAKGLEFESVFVIAAQDNVWGRASRTQSNRISLPPNLQYIRYAGATEDERLRLFYVAATRAKSQLYLTSYANTLDGKPSIRLKYLQEQANESGELVSGILPKGCKITLEKTPDKAISAEMSRFHWQERHLPPLPSNLRNLLSSRLAGYQISATHLNTFTDLVYGGPDIFFLSTILRFPRAPVPEQQYGSAMHETIEWLHRRLVAEGKLPNLAATKAFFTNQLQARRLPPRATKHLLDRGLEAWELFLPHAKKYFNDKYTHEMNFSKEGSQAGKARLTGKVDQLIVDQKSRTIEVVDFKTGRSYQKWSNELRLHKYRQQLLTYKLLVESSAKYKGYEVDRGRVIFIEPNDKGQVNELELVFDKEEVVRHSQLLSSVWRHIQKLDFPDTSKYSPSLSGIKQFENDLLGK